MTSRSLLVVFATAVVAAALSASCGTADCNESLCGCSSAATLTRAGTVTSRGAPVAGVSVTCHGESTPVAVTDATGGYAFSISTSQSPGCGFERCNNVIFADPSGGLDAIELTAFQLELNHDVMLRARDGGP